MAILDEDHALDLTTPGFVRIALTTVHRVVGDPETTDAELWLERVSARSVAAALTLAAEDDPGGAGPETVHVGDDRIRAWCSGPEQEPYVNLANERRRTARRPGPSSLVMSQATARRLALDLAAVVPPLRRGRTGAVDDEAGRITRDLLGGDPDAAYSALIRLGKERRRDLADLAVPFLGSTDPLLRDGALRALAFHLGHERALRVARRLLYDDRDTEVRTAAAMGLSRADPHDDGAVGQLLEVVLDAREDDRVRAAAYVSLLALAGADPPTVLRLPGLVPDFDARADLSLLRRWLQGAGLAVPRALVARTDGDA